MKIKKSNKKLLQDILIIHQKKLEEFTPQSINKQIKNLSCKIQTINENDTLLDKNYKAKQNKLIQDQISYILSGDKEMDYISNTFELINKYTQIECDIQEFLKLGFIDEVYKLNNQKLMLTTEYMKIIEPDYLDSQNSSEKENSIFCQNLNCNNNILEPDDGFYVCYICGYCKIDLQIAEEPGFKELQEREYKTQFVYQKETHLDDWLKRFQAKENKEIPSDIIDKVIVEASKQRIKDLSTLTEEQVKSYLKKLKLNNYYDNVINIINRINKRPPFLLTPEIETKIKEMFKQIQEPFQKYKDPNRKNMLSYSYLLHKFFLILGLPEFSKYFFLLKSPDKLRQQDHTFKKIVDELASKDPDTPWKFYPSI